MGIQEIVELLETIAKQATDWHDIGAALRKDVSASPDHILWKYVYAFEYMIVEPENKEYFDRYGVFAPCIEMQGRVFPPPLSTISNEYLEEWATVLERVKHPVLRSRLADLLWEKRWGKRPDLYARQAIDCYLEVSMSEWEDIYRAICLTRALDLCRQIKDDERKKKATTSIVEECDRVLTLDEPKPGVSLRLIEALLKLPKSEIPDAVDALLERALHKYQKDAWIVESVVGLMMRRCDAGRMKELQIYQVNRWLEEAEKSENGLLKLSHLEHALELARNYGIQEIAEKIRGKIQSIPDEELGLKTISIDLPAKEVEAYLNWCIDDRGWKESLKRFGYYGPPSGDFRKNIETIEELSTNFPILFLVTRAVYDEFNVPIRYGKDLDEKKEMEMTNYETIRIRVFGTFAPEILRRITQKHGVPPIAELKDFFITPIISEDIAENIAKAIDWYYKDEYDVAAHLLVPRIEAIIRILAKELDLPIIREPVGATPGGVVPLGSLLTMMKHRIDESWRRYFYNVLANPIGINLRNRICHGLLPKVGKEDAALLIHVVCSLRLIRVSLHNEAVDT